MIRLLNQLYAWAFGYFWIPCPICGRMFGGHESGNKTLWYATGSGRIFCKLHNEQAAA